MKLTKLLALLLVLSLMLCLLPAMAMADPEEPEDPAPAGETEPADEDADETPLLEDGEPAGDGEEDEDGEEAPEEDAEPVTVSEEETWYAGEEDTVYNNGGLVYNNGGTVYNNGGTVYNNDGLVYNNGGVTYSNGGTVYNNGGSVYSNGALVYTFGDDVEESHIFGFHRLELAADYSAFAEIEGLPEAGTLGRDGVVTVTPKDGYTLLGAEADNCVLTENEDGSLTLTELDADTTLTLRFRPDAPLLDLAPGTYSGERTLTITAPEGASVYYTTDGSEPREDNSQLYEEPILLTEGVTVTAVALADGAEPSEAVSADYAFITITAPELEDEEEGYAQPAAVSFTVENPGSVTALITGLRLEGDDAENFDLNTTNGAQVAAGQTSVGWSICPKAGLAKGSYSVTAVFTLDGGEEVELEVRFTVK